MKRYIIRVWINGNGYEIECTASDVASLGHQLPAKLNELFDGEVNLAILAKIEIIPVKS